ncbi:MAG: pitrilysin family protein [Candidatus Binataceae bacterium]|jgi:zinc protease
MSGQRSGWLIGIAMVALIAIAACARPCAAIEITRLKLSNGAVLLVSEQHQLPMVTIAMAFDAGSRRDPKGKEGLASLTAESLSEGTRQLTAEQLNQKIDFMGSSLGTSAGQDYASAGMTSLKRYFPDTLHLLASVLTSPALRDDDILRKRGEQLADLSSEEEQPAYVAERDFNKLLFGDEPYGHLSSGTLASVKQLTPADVRAFYRQYYHLGDAIIAVAGDVKADEVKNAIEQELKGLQGAVEPQPTPPAPKVAPGAHVTKIDRNVVQANLTMGFGGIARSDPDYYKLQVMNYILGGGGFASRLMKTVRSEHGLAYSIGSGFEAGLFPGSFRVVLQTKNQSANEAVKLILEQMRRIQNEPVSDAEIDSAKKFMIGSFPLKFDRLSSIASFMLQVELYQLGLDYADKYPKIISAITKDDVRKVAREYLHPDAFILVAVANQSEAALNVASDVAH